MGFTSALLLGFVLAAPPPSTPPSPTLSPCRLRVAVVRGADVYLDPAGDCALTEGARLVAPNGRERALTVRATSLRSVLAAAADGTAWRPGDEAVPDPTAAAGQPAAGAAPGPAARSTGPAAGPGTAQAPALPAEYWRALAERAREPRPCTPPPTSASPRHDRSAVRGSVTAGAWLVAESGEGLERVQPWIRSTLDVARFGDVPLAWHHRVAWQRRFLHDSDRTPWSTRYPEWAIREAALRWTMPGEQVALAGGRLATAPLGGAPTVDGAAVDARLGEAWTLGAFGGLRPDPGTLAPDPAASAFGAWLRGRHDAGAWRLDHGVVVAGSTYDGQRDETWVEARVRAHLPRWVQATAGARLDWLPAPALQGRPEVDVGRADASVSVTPLPALEVRASWRTLRPLPSLRLLALLGADAWTTSGRLHLTSLGVRYGRGGSWSVLAEGGLDLQPGDGTGVSAAGRVRWSPLPALRLGGGYRFDDGRFLRAHAGDVEADVDLWGALDLGARYRVLAYTYRGVDAAGLEHAAGATLDLPLPHGLRAAAEIERVFGDEVALWTALAQIGAYF
jgi:hypothetical protein